MTDNHAQPTLKAEERIPERVVVIVAHHDDIEFGMAGSIAHWTAHGAQVTYVICTDGGSGSNEPGVIRGQLADTRRREQRAAAAVVGVQDIRFLEYPDGILQPTLALRKELTRIIREVKPDRVVCQDPTTVLVGDRYINHPDHRAAGESALYATFPSSETRPIFPELLDEGYPPHKVTDVYLTLTHNATHYIDITAVIEKKLAALKEHVTQIGAGSAEEGALKFVRERSAELGVQVGVAHAEGFRVMTLRNPNDDHRAEDMHRERAEETT